jgi:hypothetical protein
MIKDDDKVKYVTIINLAIAEVPEFGNLFHRFKRTMPVLGRSELRKLRSCCLYGTSFWKTSY